MKKFAKNLFCFFLFGFISFCYADFNNMIKWNNNPNKLMNLDRRFNNGNPFIFNNPSFDKKGRTFNLPRLEQDVNIDSVTIDKNGKIVMIANKEAGGLATEAYIIRLTSTGRLDRTFNNGTGYYVVLHNKRPLRLYNIAVNPNNDKILVIGYIEEASNDVFLVQLNGDGTLDGVFGGGNGFLILDGQDLGGTNTLTKDIGYQVVFNANNHAILGIVSDDHPVVIPPLVGWTIIIACIDEYGNFVGGFGQSEDGRARYLVPNSEDVYISQILQDGAHIYVVGGFLDIFNIEDPKDLGCISHLDQNGLVDTTFGPDGDGFAILPNLTDSFGFTCAAFDQNGNIVVGGWAEYDPPFPGKSNGRGTNRGVLAARYLVSSILWDTSFNSGQGYKFFLARNPSSNNPALDIVVDGTGCINIIGYSDDASNKYTGFLYRLQDGIRDRDSLVILNDLYSMSNVETVLYAGALDAQQRVVCVGSLTQNNVNYVITVRFKSSNE